MITKIARHTTGAKGCYFLAGLLQVSNVCLKHILKDYTNKSLTSLLQVSNNTIYYSEEGGDGNTNIYTITDTTTGRLKKKRYGKVAHFVLLISFPMISIKYFL